MRLFTILFTLCLLTLPVVSQIQINSGGGNSSGSSNVGSSAVVYWNGNEPVKMLFGSKQLFIQPKESKVISVNPTEGYNLKIIKGNSKEYVYNKFIVFEKGKNHIYISMDSYGNISIVQETDANRKARIKYEQEQAQKQKEEQEKKEKYQSYFKQGNTAYTQGNYELALEMYTKAKALIQTSEVEYNYKLALNQVNYKKAIDSGIKYLNQRQFSSAKKKFEEAQSTKNTSEVKEYITTVNYHIEFKEKFAEAERLYKEGKYQEAKKLYEVDLKSISIVLNGEKAKELETNIALCNSKLSQKAKAERIVDLNLSIDEAVGKEDYPLALNLVDELYKLNPEKSVTNKKSQITKLYEEYREARKKEDFEEFLSNAESAFASEDYKSAYTNYVSANELYPSKEIETKSLKSKELHQIQTKERFDEAIRLGEQYFNEANYRKALKEYEKAYFLIEDDEVLVTLKSLREKVENLEEIQAKYDDLLSDAISYKFVEEYGKARKALIEAQGLMEEDQRAKMELENLPTYVLLKQAKENYEKGENKEAIGNLKPAIKMDKTFDEAYALIGLCYEEQGYNKKAFKNYGEALESNPKNIQAYFLRGKLNYKVNEFSLAIADYNEALKLEPGNIEIKRERIRAYLKIENFEEALKDCNYIIRESNNANYIESSWYDASIVHFYTKNYQDCIYAAEKAISINKDNPLYYYQLGLAYIELNKIFKADQNFEMAKVLIARGNSVCLDRDLSGFAGLKEFRYFDKSEQVDMSIDSIATKSFYREINQYLVTKGNEFFVTGKSKYTAHSLDSAKLFFTYALTLVDSFDNAYYYRGLTNFGLKLNRESESDYSKAIELNPNHDRAFMDRGRLLFSESKYLLAARDFQANNELKPVNSNAYYLTGRSYFRLDRFAEAIVYYQKAINLEKEAGFTYDTLYREKGWSHFKQKQFDEAIKMFSEGIKLNPKYPLCYFNKGLTYQAMDDHKNAVKEFSYAVTYDAGYEEAFLMRANSNYKLENWSLAKVDYERVVELNSKRDEALIGIKECSNKLKLYKEGLISWEKRLLMNKELDNDSLYNVDLYYLCLNSGEFSKGHKALDKCDKWITDENEIHYMRACLFAFNRKEKEAINELKLIEKSSLKGYKKRIKKSLYFKPIIKGKDFKLFMKTKS